MAFNKPVTKPQTTPKTSGGISSQPKKQIYTDSTGTNWKQNPKQKDGIFKTKSFSPTNAPFVSSEKPAGPGATPEEGWKQKSNLELKQKKQPTLNRQKAHELSGSKMQPGSPSLNVKNTPVGIQQKPFESQKRMDKRTNKLFAKTGQPTLGVWGRDKNHNEFAGPDKIKFNPAFDKTKEINQSLANRQKIVNQGFAPTFKLSHVDTTEIPEVWSVGNYDSYLNQDGSVAVHFDGEHVGNFKNKEEAENFVKNDTERQNNWLHPKEEQGSKIYTDSHGVQWKKIPDKNGQNYGYARVDNPNIISTQPAVVGAEPEPGWNEEETEDNQREQASELFGVDLNENQAIEENKKKNRLEEIENQLGYMDQYRDGLNFAEQKKYQELEKERENLMNEQGNADASELMRKQSRGEKLTPEEQARLKNQQLANIRGLFGESEDEQRAQASKLFGTNLSNTQPQELPEEFKTEKGIPGQDYNFYDDGTFNVKHRSPASSFEEPAVMYEGLGKFYGLNLENMVYGKNGFMKDKYPNGFPDFQGDVLYSPKHWDEFENWAKEKYGVDLEKIRQQNYKDFQKKHTPYKRW